ncbi:AbrB/MazE/SpoVT family DNA-binding domain-containing protein [Lentzea sp. NPDC005914]|uniref:AbrB/MazE/SpoVT family DNA-binding domain-containing protein n=1 Tax=Lentzea sp. NPDC005914 TaxID=3154572 RepID=UPI0034057C4C
MPGSRACRQSSVLYGMGAVDDRGRVADRHLITALNWHAGTRLNMREHGGLLVVTADPHGVFKLTRQGYLRLPADARRAADLRAGDRVFLTADVDRQTVTVFPPIALDGLILPVLPGGEDE